MNIGFDPVTHPIDKKAEEPQPVETPGDALGSLLMASRRYPLLTPSEEVELAQRIERGDLAAKERMINSNIRLVVSFARRYQGQGLSLGDLVQEGMLGLIRASEKFDWRKGFRFSTYATLWIRQSIQRGLENNGRTIRLPVHVGQRARRVGRAERELAVRLGREPTDEEVATEAKIEVDELHELREAQRSVTSLDQGIGEDGETSLGALIPDDADGPDGDVLRRERMDAVRSAIARLPEREREVIALRFGTGGEPPHTPTQTSRRLGISAQQARDAEHRALRALASAGELRALRDAA